MDTVKTASLDELTLRLPDLLSQVASSGVWGVIGAALLHVSFVWASIKLKKMREDAMQARNDHASSDAIAANPVQNHKIEVTSGTAADQIE